MLEATSHLVTNPYLQGNHAPTRRELDAVDLPVTGKLPDDLAGVYMRNGPNPKYEPIAYSYPFDGDGMIHAVSFDRGRARYRNRFVQTGGLSAEDRAGRAVYGSLTGPVPVDPALLQPGEPEVIKNVANINVIRHGGHYLALYEGPPAYEITRELETVGTFDFDGAVPGMAAHPRLDPATGELHFFKYGFQPPYLTYFVADPLGKVTVSQPIDLPRSTMIHDFVITDRRVLFVAGPATFDMAAMQHGESPLRWQPDLGARVVVLDRRHPERPPIVVETDAFWVYHFSNAYDRGDDVVVDYVRHRLLALGDDDEDPQPTMHRMVVDLVGRGVTTAPIDPDRHVEFPRMDDRRTGRPYRLSYAAQQLPESAEADDTFDVLVQYDVDAQSTRVHDPGPGRHPGEACFVPRPGGTDEDDGYVLSFVYDDATDTSDLVLLDARDFDGEPVATIHLPARVPYGLHGNWMALDDG